MTETEQTMTPADDARADRVLAAIRDGIVKATHIERATGFSHREVDNALKRLRRRGLVKYDTKAGWKATG